MISSFVYQKLWKYLACSFDSFLEIELRNRVNWEQENFYGLIYPLSLHYFNKEYDRFLKNS